MQRKVPKPAEATAASNSDRVADLVQERKEQHVAKQKKVMVSKIMLPLSILLVLALLSPFVYVVLTRLGVGSFFPVQPEFVGSLPVLDPGSLEVVAELPVPPGNIAVSSSGRIFFNFHPEFGPGPSSIRVAELKSKNSFTAFPNVSFQHKIMTCLAMRVDRQDRLWLLDHGNHGMKGSPVLYAFDIMRGDSLVHMYVFPSSVAGFGSMLNDFQVDPSGHFVYIADTSIVSSTPALIVYSVREQYAYRILSSHASMFGQSTFLDISGTLLKYGPMGLTINVDSIALDRSGSKLYYGALTGDKLYSISTSHLLHYLRAANESHTDQLILDEILPGHVNEVLSVKPVTDGISTDGAGNIWLTAVEHSAIALAIPVKAAAPVHVDGATFAHQQERFRVIKVVQDKALLRWPDGFSFGPDGLYITNSALHVKLGGGKVDNFAPFHILRLPTKAMQQALESEKASAFVLPPAGH